jgi:ubiquinone/menaquinone biosynthesis C-methylase UbiE
MRLDQVAARTWDSKTFQEANDHIHDGFKTPEDLAKRANWYVEYFLFDRFPDAVPAPGARILEIGSGHGWIMQAMNDFLLSRRVKPSAIIGLDIAPNMLSQAKQRMGEARPYEYLLYDGITIPLPDASLDMIYSVAALQHIPRQFVFNLFFEMKRLLKPQAKAIFHLLGTEVLKDQEKHHPWRKEVDNQIHNRVGHWHHFYTKQELEDVLAITGFASVEVIDRSGIVCCVSV